MRFTTLFKNNSFKQSLYICIKYIGMLKRTDYSKLDNYSPTYIILTAAIGESKGYKFSFII